MNDLKFALRQLLKNPGFTAVAVLTLALGIGANTAIFSLINIVLFRPLPVAEPERIVSVGPIGKNGLGPALSYPNYRDLRDRNEVFSGLFATRYAPVSLSRGHHNERIWGLLVSGNYFDVLGVQAVLGRTIRPEEDRTRLEHPVVVLSHHCWQNRFGGDSGIVGQTVLLNGNSFTVIGVAPKSFRGIELVLAPDVWVPMMMAPWIEPGCAWLDARDSYNLFVSGRLKSGVNPKQAEAALNILAEQLAREYPDPNKNLKLALFAPGFVLPSLRGGVLAAGLVLIAAVGLVLLIACANLANLLLARAAGRTREIAVRMAVGASRWRLIRQLLTESILLALSGGALGVAFALWIIPVALAAAPRINGPLQLALPIDLRVLLFTLGISTLAGIGFGLIPALRSSQTEVVSGLKEGTPQTSATASRIRNGLVSAQVALSLVLLVAAGLVVRSVQRLQTTNPGFNPEHAVTVSFDLGLQGYDRERGARFQRQILDVVRGLPEVRSAALVSILPLGINESNTSIEIEGQSSAPDADRPDERYASASANYFATMGIPLLAGRDFTDLDQAGSQRVAVINQEFLIRFFPGLAPKAVLGKRVRGGGPANAWSEIIGVAATGKYLTLTEAPKPFIWFVLAQQYEPAVSLIVRAPTEPRGMVAALQREISRLDPNLPLYDGKPLRDQLSFALFPSRAAALLMGSFGLLALALAALGVAGVLAFSVAQRRHEIGVRMALGARTGDVLQIVLKQSLKSVGIGAGLGLAGALAVTRFLSSLLYEVEPTDPATFAGASLLLALVAVLAISIPARRAAQVDPMEALRCE
ncbi:MAG: ABC transporter permease [Verrucomicrobia bacterium]|nr:MAG: ABC transporter permease [Verrucomicrobiota bacterium]